MNSFCYHIRLLLVALVLPLAAQAQTDTIRYVKTTGSFTNNGRSWANAKNDIQDAINDLYEYLKESGLSSGSVYVGAGTYKPTESSEIEGGGLQYTAFKIYPGIHVYGGFAADETDPDANPYEMNAEGTDYKYRPHDNSLPSLESGQSAKLQPWNFEHKTILSGSHNSEPVFTFDEERGMYNTVFSGNSYHVVWFAVEGFISTSDPNELNHALPLSKPASVDGCTITGGYAASKNVNSRDHTSYGGGAYLVDGATLSRCVVEHCAAIMRGGGVYLDGGGLVDRCMIHTCQSPGVGIMQGYGGGVCIDYDGGITRSYIVNNSSRIGGGVAISHAPHEYPYQDLDAWRVSNGGTARGEINVYSPHATACIISNNTSTAEGGGIYFFDGGVGNHLTVTRNKCVGQDITYYGRRHGRSGGVYILNGAQLYNSVIWGNKCEANNDIQYAVNSAGSTEDVTDSHGNVTKEGLRPKIFYSAVDKHDITDWANTTKNNILSLESTNTDVSHNRANYPYFIGIDGRGRLVGYAGAGLNPSLNMGTFDPDYDPSDPTSQADPNKTAIPRPIYWKPAAISSMARQGLQVTDALELSSPWIRHAHTATDLFEDIYEPMSSYGALICRNEQIGCALIANQEIAQYSNQGFVQSNVDAYNEAVVANAQNKTKLLTKQLPDDGSEATLPTIFVDPSRNPGELDIVIGEQNIGASWDKPVKNINDAIYYFKQCLKRTKDGGSTFVYDGVSPVYYDANGDCRYLINGTEYKHVQILVKGFEKGSAIRATTAGHGAYLGYDLRTASIRPSSNTRIYGGFLSSSSGTSTADRNVRFYPSIITANITNSGYQNNSAHIIALINVRNVIIDGLKLTEGNANLNADESYAPIDPETGQHIPITFGGGLIMNNISIPVEQRIDMTGNILRNGRVANCSAPTGAAIYVNGGNLKSDGTYCKAELNVINTVIRNNTIGSGNDDVSDPNFGNAGVVVARGGGATVRIDHCNIVNNCGYALETLSTGTGEDYSMSDTPNPNEGTIRIYNSVMYANGKIDRDNRKRIEQPLSCRSASNCQVNVDGDYIFLDWDAPKPKNPPHCFAVFCRDMSDQYQKWAIRKMDAFQQTVREGGTLQVFYFDSEAEANAYIAAHPSPGIQPDWSGWTWNHKQGSLEEGAVHLDYPFFENPSLNVGHSKDGDKPMNGGAVSYMPQNMNPMVNAAVAQSTTLWDANLNKRNYGGFADIGAIENLDLPSVGKVKYVRTPADGGDDNHDGNSWATAYATISHALSQCNENAGMEIWVAAGTYTENLTMKSGVNVYGGFIANGNPGKELKDGERNISNLDPTYQTIVDGNASGRVLFQDGDYPLETVWEGFIFQNGKNNHASSTTTLKTYSSATVHRVTNDKAVADGWGVDYTTTREDCLPTDVYLVGTYSKEVTGTAEDHDRIEEVAGTKASHDFVRTNAVSRDTWRANVTGDTNCRNANSSENATNAGYWAETATEVGIGPVFDYVNGSFPIDRITWTAAVPQDKRQGANSAANNNGGYWGNGSQESSSSDYDWKNTTAITPTTYLANSSNTSYERYDYSNNVTTTSIGGLRNANNWKGATSETNAVSGPDEYYYWHSSETPDAGSGTSDDYDYTSRGGFLNLQTYYHKYATRYRAKYRLNEYYQYANYYREGHYKYTNYYKNDYYRNVYYKTIQQPYRNVYEADVTSYAQSGTRNFTDYCQGTGVCLFKNGVLKNCLIRDNTLDFQSAAYRSNGAVGQGGAGVYMEDGSRLESCIIRNNYLHLRESNSGLGSGAGALMAGGTMINSAIVENYAYGGYSCTGVAMYISKKSYFYNCTIAYNTGRVLYTTDNVRAIAPAVWDSAANGSTIKSEYNSNHNITPEQSSASQFFNCILWGNAGIGYTTESFMQVARSGFGNAQGVPGFLHNCYHAAPAQGMAVEGFRTGSQDYSLVHLTGTGFVNGSSQENESNAQNFYAACKATDLFNESDYTYPANLTDGMVRTDNPYNINSTSDLGLGQYCINQGDDTYGTVLVDDYGILIDIAGAERTQDCQIDKGAYEFNGAKEIKPGYELISFDPENPDNRELCAVYYVSGGGSGLATAESTINVACSNKFQLVLDAAGRLKADLAAGSRVYSTENVQVTGTVTPTYEEVYLDGDIKKVRVQTASAMDLSQVKHVIVKVAAGIYYPIRSTNEKIVLGQSEDILPTHSIIIPHGVEVWGGYTYDNAGHDFYETYRDPLNNKTTFSGQVQDVQTGDYGQSYHVVTFTNAIHNVDQSVNTTGNLSAIADRAIIDGISIEDGLAKGTGIEDKGGAAAIVTNFAHIRNCVLQNNEASNYGGALYLQPGALVSGCVMLNNVAEEGGAIYVEEPSTEALAGLTQAERNLLYARVYNSTAVRNNASVRGGGIWYETNIRAKGVVLWQNTSNDMNNVAGVFDTQQLQNENNYPFAYCAVQSRRLPGVNNIELHSDDMHGTRWTKNSIDDMRWRGDKPTYSTQTNQDAYYYIEKLSTLVRSGMPYSLYASLRTTYPSLELRDIAGVARMKENYDDDNATTTISYLKHMTLVPEKKNNDFMEIGARALNYQMGSLFDRPFTRLFVASAQEVDNDIATNMLNSGDPLYSQQGSSMANPFQRFNDALDYVVALRNIDDPILKDVYRDTRFEIFVAGGTYYPVHNARGVEGHARASTYLLPEGITIVGGLDPHVFYGQEGYNFDFLQPMAGDHILSNGTGVDTNNRSDFYDADGNPTTVSGVTLESATTNEIWEARPRADINGNSVYEPWEFQYTTTFTGETPRGEENEDNVYHVFTAYADPAHVGTLPRRYSTYNPGTGTHNYFSGLLDAESGGTEHTNSELHRMIIFNGVNIYGGNARHYESNSIKNKQQFYRGGGICVDGSWTDGENDSQQADADERGKRDIPMMIVSSQFLSNNAVQGGAIFTNGSLTIFSCSFAQNYTQGPFENPNQTQEEIELSKDVIQYTGGGAIAANGLLRCTNTIFANNESMLGESGSFVPALRSTAKGYEEQGFGGAIWGGANSNIRLMNCNIVNNMAVSYPCVYIDHTDYGNENRFACNTIFWGNSITGEDITDPTFRSIITDINRDVFSYRTKAEKDAEEAGNADYSDRQPMFFCAYRPTFGPAVVASPEKVTISGRSPFYGVNVNGTYDPHEVPFLGESGDVNYFDVFGGNNNINITFANEGVDGPNFILPSTSAGKDGYNPSANWMPSRINRLTDNGWSYLTVTSDTQSGNIEFKRVGSDNHNTTGTKPELTFPDNIVSGGTYNFYSYMLRNLYNLTFMPMGDQYYMRYKNSNMTDNAVNGEGNMLRISSNPLAQQEAKAYIDLGVYEYQHRNLRINQNSEIDVLWVSAVEDQEKGNDGYSWETPTSNLQAAIETLLRSRNDHAKQINIISGEYKPLAVLGDDKDQSLSFTIQTRPYNNAAFTPRTGKDYGVRSLTLRGGYDPEIPGEEGYDYEKNKVVLSVERRTSANSDQLNHIVSILDAEQYTTFFNGETETIANTARGVAIPIVFDGITFNNTLANGLDVSGTKTLNENKGGAAIYYRKQTRYDDETGVKGSDLLLPPAKISSQTTHNVETGEDEISWSWDFTQASGDPKLTLRNCTFTQNGQDVANPTSAVLIEEGGGSSLVVNSLFDRNLGDPLVAANTTVLNSTFGLNGGHMKLTETTENGVAYHGEVHNSVIWKEDQNNSMTTLFEVPTTTYNTSTSTPTERFTNNAVMGFADAVDAQHNEGLSETNNDVLKGPNFQDPENGDFRLKPSKKLMNQGSTSKYASLVWPGYPNQSDYLNLMQNKHDDQSIWETRQTTIRNGDHAVTVTYQIQKARNDYDLGFSDRLLGTSIDRGAYECTSTGQRIIYMNPNKTINGSETGRTWQEAYGTGQLQTAIDAATIYAGTGKAYVFVKGQTGNSTEGSIVFRDNVDVYGGIPNNVSAEAIPVNASEEELTYTEEEIASFLNRVRAGRRGIAAENGTPTHVTGVASVAGNYSNGAVIDGFRITNGATTESPATNSPVRITIGNVALRNSIVTGNVTADATPVVNIEGSNTEGSLLYNTLVYGNTAGTTTPGTVVNVGEHGYVLNCTVVADNNGEVPIGGSHGNNASNVQNTIGVNESATKGAMFAPYRRGDNSAYTLPSFLTSHRPYWYQLHEQSKEINGGQDDGTTAKTGNNTIAKAFPDFVDFSHDHDLLGNPRRLGGKVDNGCFETWKVAEGKLLYATNATNPKPDLNRYVASIPTTDPGWDDIKMVPQGVYWTENYGGHLYPHLGSVVYVEKDGVLSLDQNETTHTGSIVTPYKGGTPLFSGATALRPGYLLVKEGGSVYGNGNTLQAEYVAVERNFDNSQYALMTAPFISDIQDITTASYDGTTTDNLTLTNVYDLITASKYDSEQRAHYNYHPVEQDSELWEEVPSSETSIQANEGWLLDWGDTQTTTARLTGWSASHGLYAYEENGTDKTVALQQYDNRESSSDPAKFTALENMGWNLKGLPYLVSDYDTGTQVESVYQMNVPHIIYTMNGAGAYEVKESWDAAEKISTGHGFMTQTAIIDKAAGETLTFKYPYFTASTEQPVKGNSLAVDFWNTDGDTDALLMTPVDDEDDEMAYTLNVDAVKWGALNDKLPQLWVENEVGTPFALSGHTPTSRLLPLGVVAPTDGEYTFALRDGQASSQNVWLVDELLHKVINLAEEDYTFVGAGQSDDNEAVSSTTNESVNADAHGRFFIQIGGERPQLDLSAKESHYKVFVRDRVLHVVNTELGDKIRVYLPGGELYVSDEAVNDHWRTALNHPGIYVVRVNNEAYKIMAR